MNIKTFFCNYYIATTTLQLLHCKLNELPLSNTSYQYRLMSTVSKLQSAIGHINLPYNMRFTVNGLSESSRCTISISHMEKNSRIQVLSLSSLYQMS